jgi:N-formylglutamate deformylase
VFKVFPAKTRSPRGIVSIPHSGELIPEEFKPFIVGSDLDCREDVDYKVNELVDIAALNEAGISVIVAGVHRVCVDLNRASDESVLFWRENTHGVPLVQGNPSASQVRAWIEKYHTPYFEALQSLLAEAEAACESVGFVDLHSMPSRPTDYHFKRNPNQKLERPDFCLSDRQGLTCRSEFIAGFAQTLGAKFGVGINDPYLGGYITQAVHTIKDASKTQNIQIEINRAIYMDERTKTLTPEKVAKLKPFLTRALIQGLHL